MVSPGGRGGFKKLCNQCSRRPGAVLDCMTCFLSITMKLKQNAPGKTLEKYTNRTKGSFGFDTAFNNTNETCFLFLLLKYLLYYLVTVFFYLFKFNI